MTEHPDHREMGYGNVDAKPDVDGGDTSVNTGAGQSGGGERPAPVENTDGKGMKGGQTDPAYRGGDNPNSTRDA